MEHLAVYILHFSYGCRCRTNHVKFFFRTYPADKNFYIIHGFFQKFFILAGAKNCHHMCCGRIIHQHPIAHFFFIKFAVILSRCCLNTVVLRLICLDHSTSWLRSAACTSNSLGQQLKRPLSAVIIIHIQGKICCDHSNQCHIRKVMSFDDHLRSHQNIRFMP